MAWRPGPATPERPRRIALEVDGGFSARKGDILSTVCWRIWPPISFLIKTMQNVFTPLVTTVREGLRYRGGENHLMWIAHRVSGLGVLLFLVLHIFGMSMAFFNPPLHEAMLNLYKTPVFALGELALAACLIYHAINGTRIAIFELKPELWTRQKVATRYALIITAVVTLPWLAVMIGYTIKGLSEVK